MFRLFTRLMTNAFIPATVSFLLCSPSLAKTGEEIVASYCNGCHLTGVLEAPRIGKAEDWAPRLEQGYEILIKHAIEGYKNMPPKGGNVLLTDDEIMLAVDFMLASSNLNEDATDHEPTADEGAADTVSSEPAPATGPDTANADAGTPSEAASKKAQQSNISDANRFNRLLVTKDQWNPPPPTDGIHDPANPATEILQPPKQAFGPFEKNPYGNRVDWVAALESSQITPRYDINNPDQAPVTLDLNIVREVKGSMPNVVYPHKQHTEWLDCVNCHPAIFIPQKGANTMSMASILMGKQCGVCHGRVAFPISECTRCHSGSKGDAQ